MSHKQKFNRGFVPSLEASCTQFLLPLSGLSSLRNVFLPFPSVSFFSGGVRRVVVFCSVFWPSVSVSTLSQEPLGSFLVTEMCLQFFHVVIWCSFNPCRPDLPKVIADSERGGPRSGWIFWSVTDLLCPVLTSASISSSRVPPPQDLVLCSSPLPLPSMPHSLLQSSPSLPASPLPGRGLCLFLFSLLSRQCFFPSVLIPILSILFDAFRHSYFMMSL